MISKTYARLPASGVYADSERCWSGVQVFVCGLATDYCVAFTAKDSLEAGFNTFLVQDACRGITVEGSEKAIDGLRDAGAHVVTSDIVPLTAGPPPLAGEELE
jgi:isochorismate hydrolase